MALEILKTLLSCLADLTRLDVVLDDVVGRAPSTDWRTASVARCREPVRALSVARVLSLGEGGSSVCLSLASSSLRSVVQISHLHNFGWDLAISVDP